MQCKMNPETERFKFFQNNACEYFPCHKGVDLENFNCLFCYCPLYALGRNCGGNFVYTEKGVKNCSHCSYPHQKENYDGVVKRVMILVEQIKEDPNSMFSKEVEK